MANTYPENYSIWCRKDDTELQRASFEELTAYLNNNLYEESSSCNFELHAFGYEGDDNWPDLSVNYIPAGAPQLSITQVSNRESLAPGDELIVRVAITCLVWPIKDELTHIKTLRFRAALETGEELETYDISLDTRREQTLLFCLAADVNKPISEITPIDRYIFDLNVLKSASDDEFVYNTEDGKYVYTSGMDIYMRGNYADTLIHSSDFSLSKIPEVATTYLHTSTGYRDKLTFAISPFKEIQSVNSEITGQLSITIPGNDRYKEVTKGFLVQFKFIKNPQNPWFLVDEASNIYDESDNVKQAIINSELAVKIDNVSNCVGNITYTISSPTLSTSNIVCDPVIDPITKKIIAFSIQGFEVGRNRNDWYKLTVRASGNNDYLPAEKDFYFVGTNKNSHGLYITKSGSTESISEIELDIADFNDFVVQDFNIGCLVPCSVKLHSIGIFIDANGDNILNDSTLIGIDAAQPTKITFKRAVSDNIGDVTFKIYYTEDAQFIQEEKQVIIHIINSRKEPDPIPWAPSAVTVPKIGYSILSNLLPSWHSKYSAVTVNSVDITEFAYILPNDDTGLNYVSWPNSTDFKSNSYSNKLRLCTEDFKDNNNLINLGGYFKDSDELINNITLSGNAPCFFKVYEEKIHDYIGDAIDNTPINITYEIRRTNQNIEIKKFQNGSLKATTALTKNNFRDCCIPNQVFFIVSGRGGSSGILFAKTDVPFAETGAGGTGGGASIFKLNFSEIPLNSYLEIEYIGNSYRVINGSISNKENPVNSYGNIKLNIKSTSNDYTICTCYNGLFGDHVLNNPTAGITVPYKSGGRSELAEIGGITNIQTNDGGSTPEFVITNGNKLESESISRSGYARLTDNNFGSLSGGRLSGGISVVQELSFYEFIKATGGGASLLSSGADAKDKTGASKERYDNSLSDAFGAGAGGIIAGRGQYAPGDNYTIFEGGPAGFMILY